MTSLTIPRTLKTAAVALAAVASTLSFAAAAAPEPTGVWIDHTGRGAVEITRCGADLCGKLVWLKNAGHGGACGLQIIGNARPVANGVWDNGWILDPEENRRYSVEITPVGNTLKVVGYLGSKMLSETMIWRRPPTGIRRCDA